MTKNIKSKFYFQAKMKNKDTRIEELEEALKESVKITTERENSLSKEKTQRRKFEQKVSINKKVLDGCYENTFIV